MSTKQKELLNHLKNSLSKVTKNTILQTLSRDTFQIIQKLPVTLSSDLSKYFENVQNIDQQTIIDNLRNFHSKFKFQNTITNVPIPNWRIKTITSKCSISSQTHHVILLMESAENEETLLNRIEVLISHLQQYPEGKNSAIRAGAIRILLKVRKKTSNGNLQAAVRVALAELGYADPVPGNGIRILSMDGGGIRGLLVLEMLKKLEELSGKKVHELFDLFCGVSTGAILAFSLGIHHTDLNTIAQGYKDISIEVFKQSRIWGTGNLVWNQAYYDTALWEKKLKEHLGSKTLIETNRNINCPKLCAISAVVNQTHLSAFVFRNYSPPWKVKSQYFGSSSYEIWQAARASAAAPTYFEECKLGKFIHQDGGMLVNNPTAVALHEAKLIWPNTPIQCVVSFGTGRIVPTATDLSKSLPNSQNTSWANKFYTLLDSATDTEGVHIILNDLLPDNVYYRFNPYLTEMIGMTEIDQKKLKQLERDALMYLRRNEDKFQEAAKMLTEKKGFVQKVKDSINYTRDLHDL